jgi:hypothetical protein
MSISDGVFALAVAMGVSGLLADGVVRMIPETATDAFFSVQSITAKRDGSGANLWVDREIFAPIHMAFGVRVMQKVDVGWRETCAMQSEPILYLPDAIIDQPVTLDWWTHGKCHTLPQGRARIVTTWVPVAENLDPVSFIAELE